jgi:hypothetical protein
MKPRKTLSIYVLLVGVMGLSIVGGILAFQIFSAATKSQATPEQTSATKPIDGNISKEVIENLTQRTVIGDDSFRSLEPIVPTESITPTSVMTQPSVATGTATIR